MKNNYHSIRILLVGILMLPFALLAQSVWVEPAFPTADHPVTIYMDKGSSSFYTNDGVYIHCGPVTDSYAGTSWSSDANYNSPASSTPNTLMTYEGGTVWSFTMTPREFFSGVGASDDVYRIGMVFRNQYAPGTNNDLNNNGGDFFVDLHVGDDPSKKLKVTPAYPNADQPLTIRFKAAGTALAGLSGATAADRVYMHSAAVTSGPDGNTWGKTVGNWAQADGVGEMTYISPDIWEITLTPETYYGLTVNENAFKLAMVFRSADGGIQVKDGSNDFFYTINPGFFLNLKNPLGDPFVVEQNTSFNIVAETPVSADYTVQIDGTPVNSQTGVSNISYSHTFNAVGDYTITVVSTDGTATKTKTVPVNVHSPVEVEDYTGILRYGPNYHSADPTKATLLLHMPTMNKEVIHVIGDFNNWTVSDAYKMKRTTSGDVWWIELTGLVPGKEYIYQYLVDGEVRAGDPYADKVSDPDDRFISEARYAGLIDYPSNKTTKRATVLQTGQTDYTWQTNDFERPAQNELNIYEVLVRDFSDEGTFQGVIDKLDYIQNLGINCIHLMPVSEFEGNESWGYNPNYYFAVDKWYGHKNKLKELIDEAHKRGIAVVNDIVLNHAFYSCAFAQLYWDQENNRPAADNPWFNAEHNFVDEPAAWWGADFNHESTHTQALVDSILDYWMTEYRFDGFRFDFTKGFSNTQHTAPDNWGSSYDVARIGLLQRMKTEMQSRHPGSYMIFEHLAQANEDKVLADAGVMMWGGAGVTKNYESIVLGYEADNKDLSAGVFNSANPFDFTYANLMSYMESHDEERLAYEIHHYGRDFIKNELNVGARDFDDYNVDFTGDMSTFIERLKLAASINLMLPGPRMVWQFGELGYDYSIDYNGRTGNKPVRWDYYDNPARRELHDFYATLLKLGKNHDVFNNLVAYDLGGNSWVKWLRFEYQGVKVVILANFQAWKSGDAQNGSMQEFLDIGLSGIFNSNCSGDWYNVLDKQWDNLDLANAGYTYRLNAGDIKIYANMPLDDASESAVSSDNQNTGIRSSWSAEWDDNGLSITVSNQDVNRGAVVYIDANPIMPSNGGTDADGSLAGFDYDNATVNLPFRGDFVLYFKEGYREFRRADGTGGWTAQTNVTGNPAGWAYKSLSCEGTRTITIPWNEITNGNGKPDKFNWLGLVTYMDNGNANIAAAIPDGNNNQTNPLTLAQTAVRFYEVETAGAAQLPFSRNSYSYDGINITDFGNLDVHHFVMNSGSGGTVTLLSGSNWDIDGDFYVKQGVLNMNDANVSFAGTAFDVDGGTFNAGTSTFSFNGDEAVTINGSPTFHNLTVNNAAGITLTSDITVTGVLDLSSGVINTNGHKVIVGSGGSISATIGEGSYINGELQREGNSTLFFPVGSAGIYAPIQIEEPDGSGIFTAVYTNSAGPEPTNFSVEATGCTVTLEKVSDKEHWDITGSVNAKVRLYTENMNLSGITDMSKIVVAHYTGGKWVSECNSDYFSNGISGSVLTKLPVTDYSPFTFGGTQDQPLPVELIGFTAQLSDDGVRLQWETTAEYDNSHFEVLSSTDGKSFSLIGTAKAKSPNGASYMHIDRPEASGTYYYKLKQVDKDGGYSFSKVVSVEFDRTEGANVKSWKLSPNPVESGSALSIQLENMNINANTSAEASIRIFDLSGREIMTTKARATANMQLYIPESINTGLYILQIKIDGRQWLKRLLVN